MSKIYKVELVSALPDTGQPDIMYIANSLLYIWQDDRFVLVGGGGSEGANYNELQNKPSINGVTLSGNKDFDDLELRTLSASDINRILT